MKTDKYLSLTPEIKLNKEFSFYGNFYLLNGEKHRNVLVINRKDGAKTSNKLDFFSCKFDVVFIMMNPGGSRPSDGNFNFQDSMSGLRVLAVAHPDKTQYQICRIAEFKPEWKSILILNTSDYAQTTSSKYFNRLQNQELHEMHSLFIDNKVKNNELIKILSNVSESASICLAWGCKDNVEFSKLKNSVINLVKKQLPGRKFYGYEHEIQKGYKRYKHPFCYSQAASINWLNGFWNALSRSLEL